MTSPQSATVPTSQDAKLLQGRYRITRSLGSGGMGDVYLAEDLRLGRLVAVKSLKQEFCQMAEVRKRIERECVMHAQLGAHPNVITLYDRVEDSGQIHLIIEFVDGTTLKDVVEKARLGSIYLTWRESVSITCQILEALAKIHAQGIVHRDVKPANVMLTQSDTGAYTAKLMDFGIARLMNPVDGATMLTRQGGSGPGTPIYMSPEQIAGTQFGPLSPASDVYAMGVVLYQMLAKRPPFQGTITDIFHGHLNVVPSPIDTGLDASYPPQLTEVVLKALAKQPANRYPSATDFRYALKRLTKATGPITTLAVANTMPAASGQNASGAIQPLSPPSSSEATTTNGLFRRRTEGAKSANRTFAAIAVIIAGVMAVLIANFFYFRSLTKPVRAEPPQQVTTGTAPAPVTPKAVDAAPTAAQTPSTPPQPMQAEQPEPVGLVAPLAPAAAAKSNKEPAEAAPKKTVAPVQKTSQPELTTPKPPQALTPIPTTPKQPKQTPVPRQTPVPDLSVPNQNSTPFSERAREPAHDAMKTPVPSGDPFQNMRINKQPAIRVN